MFITIRFINKIKPKTLLSVKHKNQYTENEKKQTRILANYVKKQLRKDKPLHPDLQTTPTRKMFSKEDVSQEVINPFSTNVPLMDKPGSWFLLPAF